MAGASGDARPSVTTSRPTFRAPGANAATADDAIGTATLSPSGDDPAAPAPRLASAEAPEDETDAPEVADYGARTLGKSCMYGARGEIIYR
ncbi:MAG: hypothetical protein AAGC67_17990, partial [Myxococcota bacterium]